MADRLFEYPLGQVTFHDEVPANQCVQQLDKFISSVRNDFSIDVQGRGIILKQLKPSGDMDITMELHEPGPFDDRYNPYFSFTCHDPNMANRIYCLDVQEKDFNLSATGKDWLPEHLDTYLSIVEDKSAAHTKDGIQKETVTIETRYNLHNKRSTHRTVTIQDQDKIIKQQFIPDPKKAGKDGEWVSYCRSEVSQTRKPISVVYPDIMSLRIWMDPTTQTTYTVYTDKRKEIRLSWLEGEGAANPNNKYFINSMEVHRTSSKEWDKFVTGIKAIERECGRSSSGF